MKRDIYISLQEEYIDEKGVSFKKVSEAYSDWRCHDYYALFFLELIFII